MHTLIVAGILAALFYWAACAFWPYLACRRCDGSGRRRAPFGMAGWRTCPRCQGRGRRVRLGRQVYEAARGLRSDDD